MASSFLRFLDHTQRRTTVGGTPLDEWSAPLPDNTQHSQQTNIHAPLGFEPTISAGELQQTYALDRTVCVIRYDFTIPCQFVDINIEFYISNFPAVLVQMFQNFITCLLSACLSPISSVIQISSMKASFGLSFCYGLQSCLIDFVLEWVCI